MFSQKSLFSSAKIGLSLPILSLSPSPRRPKASPPLEPFLGVQQFLMYSSPPLEKSRRPCVEIGVSYVQQFDQKLATLRPPKGCRGKIPLGLRSELRPFGQARFRPNCFFLKSGTRESVELKKVEKTRGESDGRALMSCWYCGNVYVLTVHYYKRLKSDYLLLRNEHFGHFFVESRVFSFRKRMCV